MLYPTVLMFTAPLVFCLLQKQYQIIQVRQLFFFLQSHSVHECVRVCVYTHLCVNVYVCVEVQLMVSGELGLLFPAYHSL